MRARDHAKSLPKFREMRNFFLNHQSGELCGSRQKATLTDQDE